MRIFVWESLAKDSPSSLMNCYMDGFIKMKIFKDSLRLCLFTVPPYISGFPVEYKISSKLN